MATNQENAKKHTKKVAALKKIEVPQKVEAPENQKLSWVKTLEKHRANGKEWVFICGYSGGIVDDKYTRVYLDASLNHAIDILEGATLYSMKSIADFPEGIFVWIDKDQWGNCRYRYS